MMWWQTTWHRDMQDNQSISVAFPTERVVKAIVYIHDCPVDCAPNAAVSGTHRLPWGIAEVYGDQFYRGTEATRGGGTLPLSALANHVAFSCPAGYAAIFDIAAWHTGLPNTTAASERQNMILSYMRDPRFSKSRGCGFTHEEAAQMHALGRLEDPRRQAIFGVDHQFAV